MTQRELNSAIAATTGESVSTIRRRGFSLMEPDDAAPLMMDWDEVRPEPTGIFPSRTLRRTAAPKITP